MNREFGSDPSPEVERLLTQISELEQEQTEGANRLRQLRLKLRELESHWPAVLGSRRTTHQAR